MRIDFQDQSVATLIPHRGPMHLVDKILWVDKETIAGEVTAILRADRPYFGPEGFEMHWLIELSAQASGALYRIARHSPDDPESKGFLVSVRHFETPSLRTLKVGDTLNISIEFEVESTPLGQSRCEIKLGDEVVAKGELTFLMEA